YLFNCRSLRGSVFEVGFFSNRSVFYGIGALLLLQAGFIYLPFMQKIFGTAPLQPEALAFSALTAAVILPLITAEKMVSKWLVHRSIPPSGDITAQIERTT
ncbi:MAG: cation transporting ATPase C-terminal domain-containing protein, partial [Thermoanaerobaculia bacterium]